MDKFVKVAIVVGVLAAGFGLFYHYVIFLPSLERDRIAAFERDRQERAAAAERDKREKAASAEREKVEAAKLESERKSKYARCYLAAQVDYEINWASNCKGEAQRNATGLRECLSDTSITTNPVLGRDFCQKTWGHADSSPHCSLPIELAKSLNATHKENKDRCASEARLGLD